MSDARRTARLAAAALLLLAGAASAGPPCAGPVDEAAAREVAVAFLAALPVADAYEARPLEVRTQAEEYVFLFAPRELAPGDRIQQRGARIAVHRETGCARRRML